MVLDGHEDLALKWTPTASTAGASPREVAVMTQQALTHGSRSARAHDAWASLPHGGRDSVLLHCTCSRSHHVATVYDTAAGRVYVAPVRARSHGSRDRVDEPHGDHDVQYWCDLMGKGDDPGIDDAMPAWCDCGPRTLSRAALLGWLAAGEHRVVID